MRKVQLVMMFLAAAMVVAPLTGWANPSCPTCKGMKSGKKGHGSGSLESKVFHKAKFLLAHQDEIGLSEEQASRIKDTKMALKKDLITRNAGIEVAALEVHEALSADKVNASAVNALVDKKYELKKQKAKRVVEAYTQLKGILTDEQQSEMKAMWKDKESCPYKEGRVKKAAGDRKNRD